jgi:protein phosphatase
MGGHQGGEIASRLSVLSLLGLPAPDVRTPNDLVARFTEAQAVVEGAVDDNADLSGMGSTGALVALVVASRRPAVAVAHMGDTRVYLLDEQGMRCLTRDHTVVEELVAGGQISRVEAASHPDRNVLTRAIGGADAASPDLVILPLTSSIRLLATTDGIHALLPDTLVADLASEPQLDAAVFHLVEAGLAAGAPDNLTCLAVDIELLSTGAGATDFDDLEDRTVPRLKRSAGNPVHTGSQISLGGD